MACLSFLDWVVLAAAVIASAFSIYTRYRRAPLYAVAKPIPLFLVISLFFVHLVSVAPHAFFPYLIFLGLMAGVTGDILLLSPKRFLAGLVAFLAGHLLYVAAFACATFSLSWFLVPVPFIFTLTFGLVLLKRMEEGARKNYRLPLLVYLVVITLMLVAAMNFDRTMSPGLPLFTLGALLFCVSDGVLAWDRFHKPFRAAQGIILPAYYGAQILIGFRAMCFFEI